MPTLSLIPGSTDLAFYAGDGVSFTLSVEDDTGAPLNISGDVRASIKDRRGPSGVEMLKFMVDTTGAAQGTVALSLTGNQTQTLVAAGQFSGVWDCQWTATGSQPVTLVQGRVSCSQDVTS